MVPGIQPFGPKVGPFSLNLNGINQVTVDGFWAIRQTHIERQQQGGILPRTELRPQPGKQSEGLFANFKNPKNVKRADIWKKYEEPIHL